MWSTRWGWEVGVRGGHEEDGTLVVLCSVCVEKIL